MRSGARYDGIADWYDAEFQPEPLQSETSEVLLRLLGDGSGSLIDVFIHTDADRLGRYTEAPGIQSSSGLRMKVGAIHLPLGALRWCR
jgi:hypothetical protein